MAFTKINAAGIGTTETVTVDGLTVINDGSFGGNLTVSGVLTYEDVTNVDSVGLITARNGIVVGSGITLSKDGDIFATGITTVSGNVKVGTGITLSPDGDGFYTGVVTATTFKGDGSQLTGVNSDVVDDTSPQLGGNLDVNTKNINFGDSASSSDDRLNFGAGTDLSIYHDGTNNRIENFNASAQLRFLSDNHYFINKDDNEAYAKFLHDGAVELYHDNVKTFETDANGIKLLGPEGGEAEVNLFADEGDDNADKWRIQALASGGLNIQNFTSGSWENNFIAYGNGAVELYHDNVKKLNTFDSGVVVSGDIQFYDGNELQMGSSSDFHIGHDGTNNIIDAVNSHSIRIQSAGSNQWEFGSNLFKGNDSKKIVLGDSSDFQFFHDGTYNYIDCLNARQLRIVNDTQGGNEAMITASPNGAVELYYNGSEKFNTGDNGCTVKNGGINIQRQGVAHAGAIYWAGFGDTNHMLWHDYFDNPNGTRGTGNGFDGIKWNVYAGIHFYKGNEAETIASLLADGACKLYYNNGLRFETTSPGATVYGSLTETSDIALKTDIQPLTNVLDKIKQITGYKYQFKETGHDSMGVTAQDVEKVFPEIVKGSEGEKTLAYSGLVGALVEAVKELSTKNDALETRIKTLEE